MFASFVKINGNWCFTGLSESVNVSRLDAETKADAASGTGSYRVYDLDGDLDGGKNDILVAAQDFND